MYLRNPGGGVEDVENMRSHGFRWIAINLGDHADNEWDLVKQRANAAGVTVVPWGRITSIASRLGLSNEKAAEWLATLGKQAYSNRVLFNAEKELDGNNALRIAMEDASVGMDYALSTEPWLFESLRNTPLVRRGVVQIQLFPQESDASTRPRDCRARAYELGCLTVHFMLGMHDLPPGAFPRRQSPYSVYTADDCGNVFAPWSPESLPALTIKFQGPLFPVGHPKYVKKLPWTIRALKSAMHRAGLTNFSQPDGTYGPRLKDALIRLQTLTNLVPSGNYGMGTHTALMKLLSASPNEKYALDDAAQAWMKL
jgi:hypothetical protein